jgi:hypothetical protein
MIHDPLLRDWARPGEASEAELRLIEGLLPFGALIAFSCAMTAPPHASIEDHDPNSESGFSPTGLGDSHNVRRRVALRKG